MKSLLSMIGFLHNLKKSKVVVGLFIQKASVVSFDHCSQLDPLSYCNLLTDPNVHVQNQLCHLEVI